MADLGGTHFQDVAPTKNHLAKCGPPLKATWQDVALTKIHIPRSSGGRLRTTLPFAKKLGGLWRGRLDGRLWRWPARTGEDVAATVTHHSDVPVTTSVRLVQHGEGEETEHKTRSSPASGGCGWVPRYEDGATHDHFMGGARRGTVTHTETLNPKP